MGDLRTVDSKGIVVVGAVGLLGGYVSESVVVAVALVSSESDLDLGGILTGAVLVVLVGDSFPSLKKVSV